MAGKPFGLPKRHAEANGKQNQREDNVSRGNPFQTEVGGSPEVILLEMVTRGGVGHYDGSEGTDEGSEENAEGNELLGIDLEGNEEADDGADERADETAHREGAGAAHGGGRSSQTRGAAQSEAVNIPELVAPEILHLDAAYRQGNAR